MRKDYVYLEHLPETEEYDAEIDLTVYGDERTSLLDHEISYIGIPEGWEEWLKKFPTGYYELEYDSDTEAEYVDGYVAYTYDIVTEPLKMTPSFKAKLLFFRRWRIDPVVEFIEDLFSPHWIVDLDWGGGGFRRSGMYLPKAIWYRFYGHKKDDYSGGYKPILRRSSWW